MTKHTNKFALVLSKIFDKAKLEIREWVVYEENGIEDVFDVQELKDLHEMGETYKPSTKIKKRIPITTLLEGFELSDKEKVKRLLSENKLSDNQIDMLVKLLNENSFSDFFDGLEINGVDNYIVNDLKNILIQGKNDHNFHQRLKVYVKSLGEK